MSQESDIVRMILGGMACITAATVTHPVDTVKIRLQIQGEMGKQTKHAYNNLLKGIYLVGKNEGMRGLYKGLQASWIREGSYSSIRLGLYEPFKNMLGGTDPKHTPFWIKLCAGSMSGFVGSVIGNPTDLLKVRMQAGEDTVHSLTWHLRDLYQLNGISGFYRGLQANVTRAMILNAC